MSKLWTIQRKPFFEELQRNKEHRASWKFVDTRWQEAFEWMARESAHRLGQAPAEHPPIWAWHSCGAWQKPPDTDDFHCLFGLDPQPELELMVGTLELSPEEYCLSFYGPWCEMLITEDGSFDPREDLIAELWYEPGSALHFDPSANHYDLQATMLSLRCDQLQNLQTTSAFFGSW